MKLFFETAAQGSLFLMMLPLGILLAVCIDVASCARRSRPLWDVLVVLLCGGLMAAAVVLLGDEKLRMYHLLGILCGALLYLFGARSLWRTIIRSLQKKKQEKGETSGRNMTE